MTTTATTRAEARRLGLPKYRTGAACKRNHVAERWTSSAMCVPCGLAARRAQTELEKKRRAGWVDPHLVDDELDGSLMKAFKQAERQRLGIDD
jgi:hypothetical protein